MQFYFKRLKEKWKINSNFQLLLIFLVFSLAGFSVVKFRKLFFFLVGIETNTPIFKQRKVDIYMLSSSKNQEDIKTALNKGCSGYIAKPLTSEKLLAHLHNNKAIQ